MKLEGWRVEAFIQRPDVARAVLLYGSNSGLVAERAKRIVSAVAGGLDDPFRVAELDRSSIDSLRSEVSTMAPGGGRRVVRIRDGGDYACSALSDTLGSSAAGLVVIEAGPLLSRSRLRGMVESSRESVTIVCDALDIAETARVIEERLEGSGVRVHTDALATLSRYLSSQCLSLGSEIEKLVTFAGGSAELTAPDVAACLSGSDEPSLDNALYAASAGMIDVCDEAMASAAAQGLSPVQIIRLAMAHFERLLVAKQEATYRSQSADAEYKKPSISRSRRPSLVDLSTYWPSTLLELVLGELSRLESACKQTGSPDHLLAKEFVRRMSYRAHPMAGCL